MPPLTWTPSADPGVRLAVTDLVLLAVAGVATAWLEPQVGTFCWLVPLVVGHFFLFCNLIRARGQDEVLWSLAFLGTMLVHLRAGWPGWGPVLLGQAPVTLWVVARAMGRSRSRWSQSPSSSSTARTRVRPWKGLPTVRSAPTERASSR